MAVIHISSKRLVMLFFTGAVFGAVFFHFGGFRIVADFDLVAVRFGARCLGWGFGVERILSTELFTAC